MSGGARNTAQCYVAAWMEGVWGKWIHVYVWLSLCRSSETTTMLLISYAPIQNKKVKTKQNTGQIRLVDCSLPIPVLFKKTFYFVLEYSRVTMVWRFQVKGRGSATCVHVSILPQTPFPSRLPRILEEFPVLYRRSWLVILSIAECTCPSQSP